MEAGVQKTTESDVKFVEFQGHKLKIRGNQGPINFIIEVDLRFYQKPKQKDKNKIMIDFTMSTARENQGFFDSLIDLVTLPVGIIFEAVINVVFAATHIKADVADYFEVNVKGGFSPLGFLKKIGAAFLNIFLPSENKIKVERPGTIDIRLNERSIKLLNKLKHVEIANTDRGLLVYFY